MATAWMLGLSLSLVATLFGTLGKVLLKLAHSSSQPYTVKVIAVICVFALNPCFDALSYAYAAQSILAPMAGLSVLWNFTLSPIILHEKVYTQDFKGAILIFLGSVMAGSFGNHAMPVPNDTMLFGLFLKPVFLIYAAIELTSCAVLVWVIFAFRHGSACRRFAFGALSGLVGGNLYFLKVSIQILENPGFVWNHLETYLIFLGAVSTAAGGIYILDIGFRVYDGIYLVSIYEAFLITTGSLSGILFFNEMDMDFSWHRILTYVASIIMIITGVIFLSHRSTNMQMSKGSASTEVTPLCKDLLIET